MESTGVNREYPGAPDASEICPNHVLLSSKGRDWDGFVVERYRSPPFEVDVPPLSEHLVMVHLGPPVGVVQSRDATVHEGREVPGSVTVVPAGQESAWRWNGVRENLQLRFSAALLRRTAQENGLDGGELFSGFGARDPHIQSVAVSLTAELAAGAPGGRLYADSAARLLAVYLLRQYSSRPREVPPRQYVGLSRRELARAVDYIGDNLSRDFSLADLASAAGLSPYHFARLFRLSTGLSPHRYVVRARSERARLLLQRGDYAIAEAAQEAGFADQSHLTRHFKRLFGATPGKLVAEIRSAP